MGRKGVTTAEVVTACVELKRQRRSVGLRNVRLELTRGSYATIARCLRQLALVEVVAGDSATGRGRCCHRTAYRRKRQVDTTDADVRGESGGG